MCREATWRFVDAAHLRLHHVGPRIDQDHDDHSPAVDMNSALHYIAVDNWEDNFRFFGSNSLRLLHAFHPTSSGGCRAESMRCTLNLSPPPASSRFNGDNDNHDGGGFRLQTFHGVPVQTSLDLGLVYEQELLQKPEEVITFDVILQKNVSNTNDNHINNNQSRNNDDHLPLHASHHCALVERDDTFESGTNQSATTTTSLVDLGTQSRVAIMAQVFKGLVTDVVDGVVGGAANPMLEQTEERVGEADTDDMTGKLETSIDAAAPVSISQMLEASLTYNLTALLTDSVTAAVSPRISSNLLDMVGSVVARVVVDQVPSRASQLISKLLIPTLAQRMEQALPDLLTRVLGPRLTDTLTRSVTHALVPALSRSLTHTAHQQYWCDACYRFKRYCNYCHESPQSTYYNSYYSSYYADFFSDYYGTYYSDAYREIDKLQHPVGKDAKNPRCASGGGKGSKCRELKK
jgi:hypothetical protein